MPDDNRVNPADRQWTIYSNREFAEQDRHYWIKGPLTGDPVEVVPLAAVSEAMDTIREWAEWRVEALADVEERSGAIEAASERRVWAKVVDLLSRFPVPDADV